VNPADEAYLFLTSDGETTAAAPGKDERVKVNHVPLWFGKDSFFDKWVQDVLNERHPAPKFSKGYLRDQKKAEREAQSMYAQASKDEVTNSVGSWIQSDRAALALLSQDPIIHTPGFNSFLAGADALWSARLLVAVMTFWYAQFKRVGNPKTAEEKTDAWVRSNLLKLDLEKRKQEVMSRDLYPNGSPGSASATDLKLRVESEARESNNATGRIKTAISKENKRRREIHAHWSSYLKRYQKPENW
jgi:hypothetical protein